MKVEEKIYNESNKIVAVRLNKFSSEYSSKILKCSESAEERLKAGQMLLDYLCNKFKCQKVRLTIANAPRLQRGRTQFYGWYVPTEMRIRIYNVTAKTAKPVSIKSFYGTLLHEFIHHYDFVVLGFTSSPHTAGFYKRISDLQEKLSK